MEEIQRYIEYINYINNTGMKPISPEIFDEDWEPAGPMIRRDMMEAGLIHEVHKSDQASRPVGIYLRPDLAKTDEGGDS